jgi:lipopolysaccharide assembly protein A
MDSEDRETHRTEPGHSSGAATEISPRSSSERGGMRTRTSAVWTAVVVLVASLILVLAFILQNLQDVSVSFLGFHGQLPLGVALLVSATLGGVIVVAAGAARVVQLRTRRRGSRPESR